MSITDQGFSEILKQEEVTLPIAKEVADQVAFEIGVLHMNHKIRLRIFKGDTIESLLNRVSNSSRFIRGIIDTIKLLIRILKSLNLAGVCAGS